MRASLALATLLLAAVPPLSADILVNCSVAGASGDGLGRGFYVPNFPGVTLTTVQVRLDTTVAGEYRIAMTAGSGRYDRFLGRATQTVTLTPGVGTLVTFDFGSRPISNPTLTFAMEQESGPGGVFYSVAAPPGCPLVQTDGTTPPLDTFRRNGVNARLEGDLPLILEYTIPTPVSRPVGITSGPDGNLWFTEFAGGKIGRITTGGAITEFPGGGSGPYGIAPGPDGRLWATRNTGNTISNLTVNGVAGNETNLPGPVSAPTGIVSGPDGNLWFAQFGSSEIGRLTTGGALTEFPIPTPVGRPSGIASGPDGNLWFTEAAGNSIGRITPSGVVTEFPIPTQASTPAEICVGPDGALWFVETDGNNVGRITTAGVITEFPIPTPSSFPNGITRGADGNLWITELNGNKVARVTPAGLFTEFSLPATGSQPYGICSGPDGNIWFTELDPGANKIGKVVIYPGGYPWGNPNNDAAVDVFDVVIEAGFIAGNLTVGSAPFNFPVSWVLDVNRDGRVDILDLVILQSFIVGNVPRLPV